MRILALSAAGAIFFWLGQMPPISMDHPNLFPIGQASTSV